ncbi:MAG: class I SAM-dependent methyltransferase [Candidatus Loosdrechtia sp.]|uniref:class I SAM-dependent methyltransferase n=1 Tax=Candidatus Loosdrechtia sp. TaxID=3101272 RepID=UPI003A6F0EB1|nr:MAG: class I SAM-dependent methyltransferase [Candidatus Jettenia sp. AMX2]
MIKRLKESIKREQFSPSILGLFLVPFYFARKGLFENISSLAKYINGRVLDVGCGQRPYKKLFNSSQYIGLELDTFENRRSKKADYFYDGKVFPFQDNEFDSVIVNEVFEHVFNPVEFLHEIYRVLKPGGSLLMTVPFVWDEHEQPHDFARYTSYGLRHLLEKSGFEIIEYRKSICDIRVVFQLLNGYIYKKTVTKNIYANMLITAFLISPFNILGELLSKVLPKNEDLYLDNVLLLKKKMSL